MSEYQYYEFRAIDKPLTERQMGELRMLSTRADITPTSFTNEYHWGDFKGNPHTMMEKYFDAFLYYANWGTNWFMLRLPRPLVDAKTLKQFCGGDSFAHWFKGEHVLLEFRSEDESGGWEDEDDPDWLASLISLRADLLNGDLRSLYLGWLAAAQAGDVDEEETEPAVPPGLKRLSASLTSLADFLRIDQKLLKVAAASDVGKPPVEPSRAELARWVKNTACVGERRNSAATARGRRAALARATPAALPRVLGKNQSHSSRRQVGRSSETHRGRTAGRCRTAGRRGRLTNRPTAVFPRGSGIAVRPAPIA